MRLLNVLTCGGGGCVRIVNDYRTPFVFSMLVGVRISLLFYLQVYTVEYSNIFASHRTTYAIATGVFVSGLFA